MTAEAALSRVQSGTTQIGMSAEAALNRYSHPAQFVCSQSCIEQGAVRATARIGMAAEAALRRVQSGPAQFSRQPKLLFSGAVRACTVFMAAEATLGTTRQAELPIQSRIIFLIAFKPWCQEPLGQKWPQNGFRQDLKGYGITNIQFACTD